MNEGALSGVLGLRGWPAVAEEAIIARDVLLAEHVGSRLHVCHVSTAGSVEIIRWAKARGVDVTAEVTPHHLLLTDELAASYDPVFKVNPPLRTATRRRRRCARRWPTARSTSSPPTTRRTRSRTRTASGARPPSGMLGLETALGVVAEAMVDTGLLDWAGVADRMSVRPGADRPPRRATAGRSRSASRPTSCWSTPTRRAPWSTAPSCVSRSRNTPYAGRTLPGAGGRDVPARPRRPCSTAQLVEARRMSALHGARAGAARPRGRPGLPRPRLRRRGRDLRRGGLHHRHDRLPGDAHRPVVPPAGRGADRAAHRQHRRQRRRRRVAPHLGRGLRRARPLPDRVELARAAHPRRRPRRAGRRRHQRHRHPRADPAPARARGDARRRLQRRRGSAPGDELARARARVARRWSAPSSPTRSASTPSTSCPRWGRSGSPSPRSTSASRAMTPRHMAERGIEVHVLPSSTTPERMLEVGADGVFFSNGPGDPATADHAVALVRGGARRRGVPLFGICFGNQVLGRALGLRHLQAALRPPRHQPAGAGPHSPARSRSPRRTTASPSTRRSTRCSDTPFGRVEVSHVCLNDDVVEGLRCLDVPAFSVQYHPEAAAGPHDAAYLFDRFCDLMEAALVPRRDDLRSRPGDRLRPDRHRPGVRVRLLRHPGVPRAQGRGPARRPGQQQPGDDHDRPGVRRRHLRRADHPGVRREDHRQGAPRRAAARPSAARPRSTARSRCTRPACSRSTASS